MERERYERLKAHCTTQDQLTRLTNVYQLGSQRKAAKHEGVNKTAVQQTMKMLERRSAEMGDSPEADSLGQAPEGYLVAGKSTMYDENGNIKLQWVKTKHQMQQNHERLMEALEEASGRIAGLAKPQKAPRGCDSDLLAIYPYGDPHIGMYAWHGDAEEDFDLDKAVVVEKIVPDDAASLPQSYALEDGEVRG